MPSTLRNERGRPPGALQDSLVTGGPPGLRRRARRCGRRGGRGVLELLFGAEERDEHLLAEALRDREGDDAADDRDQDELAEAAALLALGRRLVQGDGHVAHAPGGLA